MLVKLPGGTDVPLDTTPWHSEFWEATWQCIAKSTEISQYLLDTLETKLRRRNGGTEKSPKYLFHQCLYLPGAE